MHWATHAASDSGLCAEALHWTRQVGVGAWVGVFNAKVGLLVGAGLGFAVGPCAGAGVGATTGIHGSLHTLPSAVSP